MIRFLRLSEFMYFMEVHRMPQSWTNDITHLMQDTEVYLPSGIHFPLRRGVQQGCPLSPLIFNVVIDTLLMNLQCSPAKPKVSAYADDICTAWRNLKDLNTGAPTFDLYCQATGASLNFRKTEVLAVSPPLAKDKTSTAWLCPKIKKITMASVFSFLQTRQEIANSPRTILSRYGRERLRGNEMSFILNRDGDHNVVI
ncbi:hypothetical protein Pelo_6010 [Pelomyxa schiedti]|nr:hypothetical protein Pelo_6010 [Pelomyxa schiedti]